LSRGAVPAGRHLEEWNGARFGGNARR
jgi:hypothetical protein